jgi:hypothetical protein
VKKAEDSDAWVVQCYESEGKATDARVVFADAPREVVRCNFLEEDGERIGVDGTSATLHLTPGSVVTFKVRF